MPRFHSGRLILQIFLLACFPTISLLFSPATIAAKETTRKERPNFVFFLVDDLGAMDIEPTNPQTFYETPNIKRIAQEGMRFTNGYAANPVCSPTRYSIQTGKYPSRIDATNFFSGKRSGKYHPAPLFDRMPVEELTIAEALKEGGYRTGFLGKWHLGPSEEFWPENQGYDINKGGNSRGAPWTGKKYFSPYENPTLENGPDGEFLTERLSREACDMIDQFENDPFLIFFAFYQVHTPLMAPKPLIEKYRKKAAELAEAGEPEFALEEQIWPTDQPRRVRIRQCHPVYAAMVESMDTAIGKVLDKLESKGVAENTVVIVMSDNGGLSTSEGSPTSNLPFRGGKGWLYEGGIREPFIIQWPGVTEPGSICDIPVVSTDFYPTMLQMADLPLKKEQHLDGVSLVPLLKKTGRPERDAIYWHYPHYSNQGGFPGGAIRMGDYKLIERYEDGSCQLYHLGEDFGETKDLAEKMPEKVEAMRKKLHRWYQQVDAQFLEPKEGSLPWRPTR
jgi:arylsulfatase A-like enzyme